MSYKVKDVSRALNELTGGRCDKTKEANERFFVRKTSGIKGKSVLENPGLVWGDPEMKVDKIAVMMTLNESAIELAAATGVQAIVAHHPIADAANSGGVPLKTYLDPYGIAVFECHEAFHGLHPGISYLHGHKPSFVSTNFGDIPGNIVFVGDPLPEVKTLGNMVDRLDGFMNLDKEREVLESLWQIYGTKEIRETSVSAKSKIILGERDNIIKKVLHIFPHTGFNAEHLHSIKKENPEIDTMLTTISRVYPGSELIGEANDMKMNLVCGNSHAMEIQENGIPLAYALQKRLPESEVVIFHDRVTSVPLAEFGSPTLRDYGKTMADNHLTPKEETMDEA
ncbi:MAG: Nif3-like dinuclear metal center hexameric protein [Firmicutes bacterium]|nr:Nif3-like dinuclear metal center hexameric protein [Bacillota bacterium]